MMAISALIADDEPLLREALAAQLSEVWPELNIVAMARNGREAVEMFEALRPDICFLDVHMPAVSGVEAARQMGRRAHLVFVTAFDQYAVQAFDTGAVDYLVKPVERVRLAETVARLKERLRLAQTPTDLAALLASLRSKPTLRFIRASIGATLRLIAVDAIDYLRADAKYTLIAWREADGVPQEALVRTPLKELLSELDPDQFAQVHRSAAVQLGAVSHLIRHDNDTATVHLKGRTETLPVSRGFLPQFRQM